MRKFLIGAQIFVIVGLIVYIGTLVFDRSLQFSVVPIDTASVVYTASDELNHYFEFEPGVRENETPSWLEGYELINTINEETLNERFDYDIVAPDGTYRIITLGDSWTYGQFVSTHENFSEQLEDMFNERLTCASIDSFEVINLGVPNYDNAYAVERFRIRGQKYNPDAVVWLFIPNDFDEIQDLFLPLSRSIYAEIQDKPIETIYDEYAGYRGLRTSDGDIKNAIAAVAALDEIRSLFSLEEIQTYQAGFIDSFQENFTGSSIFYAVPKYLEYRAKDIELLQNYAQTHDNVTFFESDYRWEEGIGLPDQHPSPLGHMFLAEELFAYFVQNELSECSVR